MSPEGLQRDQHAQPPAGAVPDRLHRLPHDRLVDRGDLQPQHDRVPAHRRARPGDLRHSATATGCSRGSRRRACRATRPTTTTRRTRTTSRRNSRPTARLPHDDDVDRGQFQPQHHRVPADRARTVQATCAQCHGDGVYKGKPTTCVSCHQTDYNNAKDPNHAAGAVLHRLHRLPHDDDVERGELQPHHHGVPAHRGARAADVRSVPRRRRVQGQADDVRVVSPDRLQQHDDPEPRPGAVPDRLHRVPHHHDVDRRDVQSQQHGVPAHRGAPAGDLRPVPRRRRVQGQADGVRVVSPDRLQQHDESEPPAGAIPDRLHACATRRRRSPRRRSTTPTRRSRSPGRTVRRRAPSATATASTRASRRRACRVTRPTTTTRRDPNHQQAQFSTDCVSCHTTTVWTTATFTNHDAQYFPIYSGNHRGRWNNSAPPATSTRSTTGNSTACRVTGTSHPGKGYINQQCYSCHPRGSS